MVEEEGGSVHYEQDRLPARSNARGGSWKPCARLSMQRLIRQRPRFSPRTWNYSMIRTFSRSPTRDRKGKSAAFAWKKATELHAERLAALRNELLAQRANDVRDVGQRVLLHLTGITQPPPAYPEGSVLIAED
jgi:hypothetical protein